MDNLSIQDLFAYRELSGDNNKHDCRWSMSTSLWVIVGIIFVIALLWYVHRTGNDKADLAASIQKLYGRVDAIEPAVTAQGNNIYALNSVMSATTQAVGDFKTLANEQLASLNGAVFTSRCGCGNGCGNGSPRFVKRDNYCLNDSSLQAIETCG